MATDDGAGFVDGIDGHLEGGRRVPPSGTAKEPVIDFDEDRRVPHRARSGVAMGERPCDPQTDTRTQ